MPDQFDSPCIHRYCPSRTYVEAYVDQRIFAVVASTVTGLGRAGELRNPGDHFIRDAKIDEKILQRYLYFGNARPLWSSAGEVLTARVVPRPGIGIVSRAYKLPEEIGTLPDCILLIERADERAFTDVCRGKVKVHWFRYNGQLTI